MSLQDKEWHRLAEAINRGKCILVLGPEIVTVPEHGNAQHRSVDEKLARELRSHLKDASIPNGFEGALPLKINKRQCILVLGSESATDAEQGDAEYQAPNEELAAELQTMLEGASIPNGYMGVLPLEIDERHCLLALGPKTATDQGNPPRRTVNERLAAKLEEDLDVDSIPDGFEGALPLISQYWLWESREHHLDDLKYYVATSYREATRDTKSEIHEELAKLPFSICLTATPDHAMYDAFKDNGKEPNWVPFGDTQGVRNLPEASEDTPLVYGLVGDIDDEESLIVTETELIDAIFQIQQGSKVLPEFIASELREPRNSFLYIGFDFGRCYPRLLIHAFRHNRTDDKAPPSLAVAPPLDEDGRDFVVREEPVGVDDYFKIVHSVEIRHTNWHTFATDLREYHEERYGAPADQPREPEPELPSGAPIVFLCHDSSDRAAVESLQRKLHANGVGTWRDVSDLRGGDDWVKRIPYVLTKQVNYVLICESPQMLRPGEKYFRNEIDYAVNRQKSWGSFRFMIPATLIEIPEKLAREPLDLLYGDLNLHRLDLTSAEGIQQLCDQILEDWAKRHEQ